MFDYNTGGRTRTDSLRTTLATLPAEITQGECGAKVVPDILKIKEGNNQPRQSAQVFLHPLHYLVFRFKVVPGV